MDAEHESPADFVVCFEGRGDDLSGRLGIDQEHVLGEGGGRSLDAPVLGHEEGLAVENEAVIASHQIDVTDGHARGAADIERQVSADGRLPGVERRGGRHEELGAQVEEPLDRVDRVLEHRAPFLLPPTSSQMAMPIFIPLKSTIRRSCAGSK